jgi:hypothetical protein
MRQRVDPDHVRALFKSWIKKRQLFNRGKFRGKMQLWLEAECQKYQFSVKTARKEFAKFKKAGHYK